MNLKYTEFVPNLYSFSRKKRIYDIPQSIVYMDIKIFITNITITNSSTNLRVKKVFPKINKKQPHAPQQTNSKSKTFCYIVCSYTIKEIG